MPDGALLDTFLDHVTAFDAGGALDLVLLSAHQHGVCQAVTALLGPAQQEVGRRWEFGEWTVSQEHAATAIVDDCLAVLRRFDRPTPEGPHLAVVCAEGEWHVTPARMAGLLFEQRGWRVSFLGASTPGHHLSRTLAQIRPDVVAVSCSLPLNLPGTRQTVEVAHELGVPVVVGGAAVGRHRLRIEAVGGDAGGDIGDVESVARAWLDRPVSLMSGVAHHEHEVALLRWCRSRTVDAAFAQLLATLPSLGGADDLQLERTRQDLAYILQFLEVALDVGDPSVFSDFLGWLTGILAVRGVPVHAVQAGIWALADHLPEDLDAARQLLLQTNLFDDRQPDAS